MKQLLEKYLFSSLFVVILLASFSMQILTELTKLGTDKNAYSDQQSMMNALLAFLVTLVVASILKIYALHYIGLKERLTSEKSFSDFFIKNLKDWTITEVRIQFRVIIGLLMLIIPGVIEAVRLSLAVPLVFFNKKMDDPTYDPIHDSRNYIHFQSPYLIPLFVIMFFAPIVRFFIIGERPLLASTLSGSLLGVLNILVVSLFSLTLYCLLIYIYKKHSEDQPSNTQGDL